jgi:hypothetical protein
MAEANWSRRLSIATAVLVTIGLGLRSFHYLRDPSVWHDEAVLMVNILSKSFGELFGPLDFNQAAPPLFLWIAKAGSQFTEDVEEHEVMNRAVVARRRHHDTGLLELPGIRFTFVAKRPFE